MRTTITAAIAASLLATTAPAATITSAGFTENGTYEINLFEAIAAGESGTATILAPRMISRMVFSLGGDNVTYDRSTLGGYLEPDESISFGFSNQSVDDGTVELSVAWLERDFLALTGWNNRTPHEQGLLVDGFVAGFTFDLSDSSMGGGDGIDNDTPSTIPLPASFQLMFGFLTLFAGFGWFRRTAYQN